MKNLFRKWWIVLLLGVLLLVLSFYVFNNPAITLNAVAFCISLLISIAGMFGIFKWVSLKKAYRNAGEMFGSIIALLLGILLMTNLEFTRSIITFVVVAWVIILGVWMIRQASFLNKERVVRFILAIAGFILIIGAVISLFNFAAGALAISTILGLQILFAGLALVAVAFYKRLRDPEITDPLNDNER